MNPMLLLLLASNVQGFLLAPLIRKFGKDSVILNNRWGRDPDVQFEETKNPIFEPPAKPSIYELARLSIKDGCRDTAKLQEIAGQNCSLELSTLEYWVITNADSLRKNRDVISEQIKNMTTVFEQIAELEVSARLFMMMGSLGILYCAGPY